MFEPTVHKCHELEVDKAALEAEKLSLAREVEEWKDHVKSLVSKFYQILTAQFLLCDDTILSSDKNNNHNLSYAPSKFAVILDNQPSIAKRAR